MDIGLEFESHFSIWFNFQVHWKPRKNVSEVWWNIEEKLGFHFFLKKKNIFLPFMAIFQYQSFFFIFQKGYHFKSIRKKWEDWETLFDITVSKCAHNFQYWKAKSWHFPSTFSSIKSIFLISFTVKTSFSNDLDTDANAFLNCADDASHGQQFLSSLNETLPMNSGTPAHSPCPTIAECVT